MLESVHTLSEETYTPATLIPDFDPSNDGVIQTNDTLALSPAQLATAEARTYLEKLMLPTKSLNAYLQWRDVDRYAGSLPHLDNSLKLEAKMAFETLFKINENPDEMEKFRRDYGEEAEGYIGIKNKLEYYLISYKEKTLSEAASWGIKKRLRIGLKISSKLGGLTDEQRNKLLEIVGYSKDEIRHILTRLAISGVLYPALYFAEDKIPDAAGITGGILRPLLDNDLTHPITLIISAGSAFVYYGTQALKIEQCLRFLKDRRSRVIPSPTAAVGYHVFEKLFSDRPKIVNWATRMGYIVNPFELSKEAWWGILPISPSIFLTGNLAAIAINLVQLGVFETAYRIQRLKSRTFEKLNSSVVNMHSDINK